MTELQKTAINDLQEQHKTYQSKYGRKEKIIAQPTLDALINFCEQSEEFAEAVHDSNNTFSVCLSKIIENSTDAISDIEVFQKAVKFYMPSATVNMVMTISTGSEEKRNTNPSSKSNKAIHLNLLDLM